MNAGAAAERVILLHGLSRTPRSMARLRRALLAAGYAAEAWSYPSRAFSLAELIQHMRARLEALPEGARLHLVGHSLGGLLARAALSESRRHDLGRLVLIAVPNRGAAVVSHLLARPGLRLLPRLLGRVADELGRDAAALKALGNPPMEIGAIAGARRFHPVNPSSWVNAWIGAGEVSDGTVELDSALPPGLPHYTVDASHSFICDDERVIAAVLRFLKSGKFER